MNLDFLTGSYFIGRGQNQELKKSSLIPIWAEKIEAGGGKQPDVIETKHSKLLQ